MLKGFKDFALKGSLIEVVPRQRADHLPVGRGHPVSELHRASPPDHRLKGT
jgi:hypothetical protein